MDNTDIKDVKGIIFDYGGTIDSRGDHWSEVIWRAYMQAGVPVLSLIHISEPTRL